MKAFIAPSAIDTSMPPEVISMTVVVTTEFLRRSTASVGSWLSCLMPSEIRSFSMSTSSTRALTVSPLVYFLMASSPGVFQSMSLMWTMPSRSGPRPTKRPNSVMPRTSPSMFGADRVFGDEGFPGIVHHLLEAQRDAALLGVDIQHHHVDFLRRRDDLAGVDVLLGPAHFRDVDQAFDAVLEFNERAVVGDVGDAALELGADRVFRRDAIPRIGHQLLHAQRNTLGFRVDLDDLDFDFLADFHHLATDAKRASSSCR